MNIYAALGARTNSPAALDLSDRLSAWHDAMVAHERRLNTGGSGTCDEDCPHALAPAFWAEALEVYGEGAHQLAFLRVKSLARAA
jgi:hypothetical protein